MGRPSAVAEPVLFKEAIEYFRGKTRIPTRAWTDVYGKQHARGFMVAGAMRDNMLADFQTALAAAIEDGTTIDAFRGEFDKIVAKNGWSYNGGRGWRTATIFRTNLRSAYNAGRWQQSQRTKKARPYLRYVQIQRAGKRPEHSEWHGVIRPVDDPFWDTHLPQNGWGCECTFTSLSEREMKRRGFTVSDPPEVHTVRHDLNSPDGPFSVEVPEGIDPGFEHNPGKSAFGSGQHEALLIESGERPREIFSPGYTPADLPPIEPVRPSRPIGTPLRNPTEEATLAKLAKAIGGEEAVFVDPTGHRVAVTPALVKHWQGDLSRLNGRDAYFEQIPEVIEDPAEIWLGFEELPGGRLALKRRYVKLILDAKRRAVLVSAGEREGYYMIATVIGGSKAKNLDLGQFRKGILIYRKGDG